MEECEQQKRRDGVEQHIDKVMPSGVKAEKLDVEHVGEASDGKPVRRFGRREGPRDAAGRDALKDVGVAGNVIGIVEIDEIVAPDGQVGEKNRDEKGGVDPKIGWRSGRAFGRQAAKIIMTQAVPFLRRGLRFAGWGADYDIDDANRAGWSFIFARPAGGSGGRGETQIAMPQYVQVQLFAVYETLQHEDDQKRLQGPEQQVQKRVQGLTTYTAE